MPDTSLVRPSLALSIDLWSDVACPWCWIGKRRLSRALATRPGLPVELRWRPFILRPDLPPEGIRWEDFVREKFGGPEQAAAITGRVAAVGQEEGIPFHFERMTRAPHTEDAHRLILLAQEEGRAEAMAEALFHAHFTQGLNLNDREVLRRVAVTTGLDGTDVSELLSGDRFADAVRASLVEAVRLGVQGVPFFVFGGRYAVSGAHPPEVLARAMDAALGELSREN